MMGKRRTTHATLVIILLYCAAIAAIGLSAKPEASDVAVVLGNKVYNNGEPSPRLQARLNAGIDMYKNKLAPVIMVSGGVGKSGYNEATVMAEYLRQHGIPDADIIIDKEGVNTRATAVNTAKLMQEKHWQKVVIVSQYYHLPRCTLAFKQSGITHFSAYYPVYFEPLDIFAILREAVAMPTYLIGGWLGLASANH